MAAQEQPAESTGPRASYGDAAVVVLMVEDDDDGWNANAAANSNSFIHRNAYIGDDQRVMINWRPSDGDTVATKVERGGAMPGVLSNHAKRDKDTREQYSALFAIFFSALILLFYFVVLLSIRRAALLSILIKD